MKPFHSSLVRSALAPTWIAVLGASAAWAAPQSSPSRPPAPPSPPLSSFDASASSFDVAAVLAAPLDAVLFDQPGDGALWARGSTYKARFDSRGASLIPFFGSDAPRNFPLDFHVARVTCGDVELTVASVDGAVREGASVRIDHGAFVEQYELALESVEQRFVFDSLPAVGDLVVRMDVATELQGADLGKTLRFENELGRVDYGEAFALDADGARIALDSVLVDGVLELRVPAEFVAQAHMPLVIDPFVTFFTVAGGTRSEFLPDVAYDVTTDRWGVAYTDVWSATDYDCYVRFVSGANVNGATSTIDFTSETWTTPVIANNNASDSFLVCAAVVPSSGIAAIRGRIVASATGLAGAVIPISPLDGAYRNSPDVGGDPYPSVSSSYYCVVWARYVSTAQTSIERVVVSPSGTVGTVATLSTNAVRNEYPAISNSAGIEVGDPTVAWTVVWQYEYSSFDHDIYGAQLSWSGAVAQPQFAIETSTWDEKRPVVSSILDSTALNAPRPYMVVYERDYGSDHDLLASVRAGATALASPRNLVGDFASTYWYRDQRTPTVDSDGEQFLVGFDERDTPGGPNPDVWMCSYFWANGALAPCEVHVNFAGSSQVEGEVAVHSMASSAGPRARYFGAWVFQSLNNGYDVQGGPWNGCSGGWVESFCRGDGTGAACPCGNNGAVGRGCANSANANGGLLSATGDASIAHDSFQLHAVGLPLSGSCLFFEGFSAASAFPFGDGLRCISGFTYRLPLKASQNGAAHYPQAGEPAIHTWVSSAGQTTYYQAWYRDSSASFCNAATYNLTNGLKVVWAP